MKTTVEALKDYYSEIGGTSADVVNINTIPDMIDAINALVASGGTTELPPVTTTDNGKVLTVVEGDWAAAAASGGGSTDFVITVSWEDNDFVVDKTYDEIVAAYDSGTPIKLIVEDPSSSSVTTCFYEIRDFQVQRQNAQYTNGLSITAILPYRLSGTDNNKKAALNVFCLSAYYYAGEGSSVNVELYKHLYTIADDESVSGTYEKIS